MIKTHTKQGSGSDGRFGGGRGGRGGGQGGRSSSSPILTSCLRRQNANKIF